MLRTYKIKPYSSFDNWTFHSGGANWSDIYDRLLRITTKLTSRYASDVLTFINHMNRYSDTDNPFDFVVLFRESGVAWFDPGANDTVEFETSCNWFQVWRVSRYGNRRADVTLTRVYLAASDARGYEIIGL